MKNKVVQYLALCRWCAYSRKGDLRFVHRGREHTHTVREETLCAVGKSWV